MCCIWAVASLAACSEAEGARRYARQGLAVDAAGSAELTLGPAQRVRLETRGARLRSGLRLHVWDPESKREVAFAKAWGIEGDLTLEYQNPHAVARTYTVLFEAPRKSVISLLRDGRPWLRDVPVAVRRGVPSGKGSVVQLASVPGGARAFVLYALDCEGRLRAIDRSSAPTGLPLVRGFDDLCSVVVQSKAAARVSLYVNDAEDRDRDGLGRALERALSTCDDPREPVCARRLLASYYLGQGATRDSDRDGISDRDEVLGAGRLLDFPRYGASPLHKDVFVEIDHDPRLRDVGLREDELAKIAELYAAGSARELKNPDGKPGVALHFDAGFEPADPKHAGLFGRWGGSKRTTANNYRSARSDDFTPARVGTFRYAFMTNKGRGQARSDSFTVNRELQRVSIFAHELGHTLGLGHHGHDAWGKSNCKPNYFSLMNYVYQNREGVGFSQAEGVLLDPTSVLETIAQGEALPPPEVLSDAPLELDAAEGGIDWNRDGVISREPVRASLSWATYKSCGSAARARTTLRDAGLAETTPALTRIGKRLYALFVSEDGGVHVRHGAVSGPDPSGSCPLGDGEATQCTEWSLESLAHGIEQVKHIAPPIQWSDDAVLLGYTRTDGQVRVAVLAAQGEVLDVRGDFEVPGARSDHAPALARASVAGWRYGADALLRVFYRPLGPDAVLMQASAVDPAGPYRVAPVFDVEAVQLTVGSTPSVLVIGTGELCGVFPDPEGFVRLYCYEPDVDAWRDLTRTAFFSGLGPKSAGPVGLAYHRYRHADGSLVQGDATRGALMLSFTEPESSYAKNPDNPHYFISESLSAATPARTHLFLRWRGSVIDEWTNLAAGTGLAIYEDLELSALKGLMLARVSDATRLDVLPFADGVYEQQLGSGNDFVVMELGICEGLKGKGKCPPSPR